MTMFSKARDHILEIERLIKQGQIRVHDQIKKEIPAVFDMVREADTLLRLGHLAAWLYGCWGGDTLIATNDYVIDMTNDIWDSVFSTIEDHLWDIEDDKTKIEDWVYGKVAWDINAEIEARVIQGEEG